MADQPHQHPVPLPLAVAGIPPASADAAPLERRTSRLAGLALTRTTDAHPPHHAHFDVAERPDSDSPTPSLRHEPHHRDGLSRKHQPVIDIEHVPVDNDPRDWSDGKKNFVMVLLTVSVVCFETFCSGLRRLTE
jgi:hypothetical protein